MRRATVSPTVTPPFRLTVNRGQSGWCCRTLVPNDSDAPDRLSRARANGRLLTPSQLAEWLNVDRSYSYDHAAELGAMRLGTGPKPRLRFDLEDVKRADLLPS
jgi:hypothetical protein